MEALADNPTKALKTYKKANADELAALLTRASEAYYNTSNALLTDDVFDIAERHLQKIAPKHPFLIADVGARVVEDNKVPLPYYMGSLDKIKDEGQKAIAKYLTKHDGGFIISHKLDGNSAMIVYEYNGKSKPVVKMYSRGDGKEGQDITKMLTNMKVPALLAAPAPAPAHADAVQTIAVRGELVISKKNWDTIKDKGANARNMVAGVMHSKRANKEIASLVDFVAYELLSPSLPHGSALKFIESLGFNVVHHTHYPLKDITVDNLSKILVHERAHATYEIDGIVVTHDAVNKPSKEKNPTYAFAFKSILTQDEAEVIVSSVEWRVSKDGYIKPTIVFPAVTIAGASIQRATGINASFIENNVIGIGSHVVIIRSGDVIPKVVRVTRPAPRGAMMPTMPYVWNETHVDIVIKEENNEEQRFSNLVHFTKSLSLKGVADGTIKKLFNAGYDTVPKLLKLQVSDIVKIEGFQTVSATAVVKSLSGVRTAPREDLMKASNLFGRSLGERKIKTIVQAFPGLLTCDLDTLGLTQEDLMTIDGIGSTTATSFLEGMTAFKQLLDDIGLCGEDAPPSPSSHNAGPPKVPKVTDMKFKGQTIVFTGFRNKEWESKIEAAGGKVTSSISKNTTLVVAADPTETSAKLDKARDLSIPITSKTAFEATM